MSATQEAQRLADYGINVGLVNAYRKTVVQFANARSPTATSAAKAGPVNSARRVYTKAATGSVISSMRLTNLWRLRRATGKIIVWPQFATDRWPIAGSQKPQFRCCARPVQTGVRDVTHVALSILHRMIFCQYTAPVYWRHASGTRQARAKSARRGRNLPQMSSVTSSAKAARS